MTLSERESKVYLSKSVRIEYMKPATEFSIILCVDETTAEIVVDFRELLPKTPFRDDPPHVTLIRVVSLPESMSDDELLSFMRPKLNFQVPLKISFKKVADHPSEKYGTTTVLEYKVAPELIEFRKSLIKTLRSEFCIIPKEVADDYSPHMTLILGKTLDSNSKKEAAEIFSKTSGVYFTQWKLLRYEENDKTKVKVVEGDRL